MTRQRKLRPVKHLQRYSETLLGVTRYVAACGATGTAQRDFSPSLTRNNVQVVTCQLCIMSLNKKG